MCALEPGESWDAQIRRRLQGLVDPLCREIVNGRVNSWEARDRWAKIRTEMVICVPEQVDLVDRIYGSRIERLINQFCIPREIEDLIEQIDEIT